MPELPEVETIKRGLEKKITGLKVKKIEILSPKSFIGNSKLLEGKKVLKVGRRAKILILALVGELGLLIHLKMSGQIIYESPVILSEAKNIYPSATPQDDKANRFIGGHPTKDMFFDLPNKHTRVIFTFSDNSKLFFNDMRRFGWVKVVADDLVREEVKKVFSKLGPEPLEKEFSWEVLKTNLLKHKTMPIKVAILDQSIVSGVGNIYASEACFLAKIDPQTKVCDLTDLQIKRLHQGIVESLTNGIKYGGSTKTHFVDAEGNKGYFLDYAYCYGRDGKECKICKTEIKKIKLGGRGTYFCPKCQNA